VLDFIEERQISDISGEKLLKLLVF